MCYKLDSEEHSTKRQTQEYVLLSIEDAIVLRPKWKTKGKNTAF